MARQFNMFGASIGECPGEVNGKDFRDRVEQIDISRSLKVHSAVIGSLDQGVNGKGFA
jgi:hypothetical protein